jgi:hypothetical protein
MTSPNERAHSDHRLLSHNDLFPEEREKMRTKRKENLLSVHIDQTICTSIN